MQEKKSIYSRLHTRYNGSDLARMIYCVRFR